MTVLFGYFIVEKEENAKVGYQILVYER